MNKSLNANGDLKLPALLGLGGALFSMHFGASSMVWPMNWGKESGTSFFLAFAGAFITSLLLVLFAYIAMSRGNGTYSKITVKAVGKKFGVIYSCITIIVLGPLYAIPRMSAAAWDSIVQAFGLNPDNRLMLIIFTVAFYLVTYWFLMNPGKAMDRISSLLFPILIIIVIIVVGKGMIDPIADPVPKSYDGSAFAYGFTNGYATAEILCALVFGTVIINSLKEKGVAEDHMNKNIIRVGIVGLAILTCTHFCHMWIGAHTGGTIDLTYTALYTEVAIELLGRVGGVFFCLALFFAALTTAIGMASGCAEFFIEKHACDGQFVKMARAMGMKDAQKPQDFIEALEKLQRDCGVADLKMSDYGIERGEFMTLAVNARETMGGLFLANPCPMSDQECAGIFEKSYR